jgi:hypothetical protein
LLFGGFGSRLLLRRMGENRRAILRADIGAQNVTVFIYRLNPALVTRNPVLR